MPNNQGIHNLPAESFLDFETFSSESSLKKREKQKSLYVQ